MKLLIFIGLFFLNHQGFSHPQDNGELPIPHPYGNQEIRQTITSRESLAQQVFRNRISQFIHSEVSARVIAFLNHESQISQKAISALKNSVEKKHSLQLFQKTTPKTRSQIGSTTSLNLAFNLRNDQSQLELIEDDFKMALYQNRTIATLRGQGNFTDSLFLTLNKKWTDSDLRASLNLPWTLPYYQATLSHDFSRAISSTFSAQAPFKKTNTATKVEIQFAFSF